MKNKKYDKKLFWTGFLLYFAVTHFYFFVPGMIALIASAKMKELLYVGIGLLAVDFVVSLYRQLIIKNSVEKNTDKNFEPWADAMIKNNSGKSVIGMVNAEIARQNPDMTQKMKILTYNIHHCADGIDNVAAVIRNADADIVGLQEADSKNERSSMLDQPALLAEKAGYMYYRFTRAIGFRGGEYGTAILSKFPIISYETLSLPSGKFEGRSVGHAAYDVNGKRVDHFNTHLSYESGEMRAEQLDFLAKEAKKSKRYVITGDFNTEEMRDIERIGAKTVINRGKRFVTYPKDNIAIDNILFSEGFTETGAGTVDNAYSDHFALFAEVEIKF